MSENKLQNEALVDAVRVGFEAAWRRSSRVIEISRPTLQEDGIEYTVELDDPFSGSTRGRYKFEWSEIADAMRDPNEVFSLEQSVEEWLIEESEADGEGEFVTDSDGRVHFREDFDQR